MGGTDEYHKPSPAMESRQLLKSRLKVLSLVVVSNLITIFIFTGPFNWSDYTNRIPGLLDTHNLLRELNTTQHRLISTEFHLSEVQDRLQASNSALDNLLGELNHLRESLPDKAGAAGHDEDVRKLASDFDKDPFTGWGDVYELPAELRAVVMAHKLPLGFSPAFGSSEIHPPLGHACRVLKDDLKLYMSYQVGGECPSDANSAQQLMLKGCEPLPRRRCTPKKPANYVEPTPFPESLWTTPPDTSITWDAYRCKNYACLINRKKTKVAADCKDCFDLKGREKTRWLYDNGALDYGIDEVLEYKQGTIRIGLDIGGGSGTFAARMRERNVTIITSSMNFDGPFNNFIASRGLVPIHMTVSQRLPFFDNTLDIVHSMHVLSNWIPDTMLDFLLYDIYRILRPGGLFWLDHFFCIGHQMNGTYVPIFDKIGFHKIRWTAGRKLDRGAHLNEWYISALLEKPMT